MFISVSELSKYWNIKPRGVLHVGAHLAEEASDYKNFGWAPIIWVEAQPNLVKILNSKLDPLLHKVIEAAIWEKNGVPLKLHIASNSQSTSLLNFGSHADSYPDITYVSEIDVVTKRLDSIIKPNEMPNFINLDIQGVELKALKSLGSLINRVDAVYTEVNKREVYEKCDLLEDIDYFLIQNGFRRIATRWELSAGWGDALYVSENVKRRSFRQYLRSQKQVGKFYAPQIKSNIKQTIERKVIFFKNI